MRHGTPPQRHRPDAPLALAGLSLAGPHKVTQDAGMPTLPEIKRGLLALVMRCPHDVVGVLHAWPRLSDAQRGAILALAGIKA